MTSTEQLLGARSGEYVHERRGSGEPLVLVHGIGHRWQAWSPVIDLLAREHEVWAIDLPGFGQAPMPPGGLPGSMSGLVDEVEIILDALGLQRPHIAGNSLGGGIALELGDRGRAASVTGLSPAGFFDIRGAEHALRVLGRLRALTRLPEPGVVSFLTVPVLRRMVYRTLFHQPGTRLTRDMAIGDAMSLRDSAAYDAVAARAPGYRFTGEIRVPTTIAWGTRDMVLTYDQAVRARAELPQARHVPLPMCGHVPMIDNPDLVADTILQTTRATRANGPVGAEGEAGAGSTTQTVPLVVPGGGAVAGLAPATPAGGHTDAPAADSTMPIEPVPSPFPERRRR